MKEGEEPLASLCSIGATRSQQRATNRGNPCREEGLSPVRGGCLLRIAVVSGRNLSHNIPYEID